MCVGVGGGGGGGRRGMGEGDLRPLSPVICKSHELWYRLEAHRLVLLESVQGKYCAIQVQSLVAHILQLQMVTQTHHL